MDQDNEEADLHLMLGLLMVLHAFRTVLMNLMCAVTILSNRSVQDHSYSLDQDDPVAEQDVDVDPNESQSSVFSTEVQSASRKRRRTSRDPLELLSETMKESSNTLIQISENMCKSFDEACRGSHVEVAQELYTELLKVEGLTTDEISKAHIRIAESRNLMIAFPLVPDERKAGWVRSLIN